MRKRRTYTPQEEEDRDLAYAISDKRTYDLTEARRLVELEKRTATLEEKLAAIRDVFEYMQAGMKSDALDRAVEVLWKETRE